MNAILNVANDLSGQWVSAMGPILWQSALLAVAIYFLTSLLRRKSAVLRFWLWMLIPLRLLIMPLLTITLPMLPAAESPPVVSVSPAITFPVVMPNFPVFPIDNSTIPRIAVPVDTPTPIHPFVLPPAAAVYPTFETILLTLWIIGLTFFSIKLVVAWLRLNHTVARAQPARDPKIMQIAQTAAQTLQLNRPPRILIIDQEISPFILGVFSPNVILPRAFVQNVKSDQLLAVLTHEFAHLRRFDQISGWMIALCHIVYFFHPVFYLAKRFLLLEREIACDELVLSGPHIPPAAYADALIDAARSYRHLPQRTTALVITAESNAHLKKRLTRIASTLKPNAYLSKLTICLLFLLALITVPGIALTGKLPLLTGNPLTEMIAVQVHVTDADGNPVPAAGVEALADYKPIAQALTDNQGNATLDIPADVSVQWIYALKSGQGFDYFENYSDKVMDGFRKYVVAPDQVSLTLKGARTIRILALDSSDQPVPEVRFAPWTLWLLGKNELSYINLSGSQLATAVSNRQGMTVFDWWPTNTPEVEEAQPDFTILSQSDRYHWPDPPAGISFGKNDLDLTARLLRNSTISGIVIFPDGRPAPDILILTEGKGPTLHNSCAQTRTDSDGAYSLNVSPNQSYIVSVSDDNYAACQTGVLIRENQSAENVNLMLSPGTLIQGQLTFEPNTIIEGELVILRHLGAELPPDLHSEKFDITREQLVRTAITDHQGRYAFRAVPGNYQIGAVGSEPDANHRDFQPLTIFDQMQVTVNMQNTSYGNIIGFIVSPVKANHQDVFGFFPPLNECTLCHRPVLNPRYRRDNWEDRSGGYYHLPEGKTLHYIHFNYEGVAQNGLGQGNRI